MEHVLDIGIVGAGIAGLSAAIALRHAGHRVEIYEQSRFNNEVGAAITMPPHSAKVLRQWGFELPTMSIPYGTAGGTRLLRSRRKDSVTLEMTNDESLDEAEERFGATFVSYHRADLHSELKRIALEAGATIVLERKGIDLDCSTGRVTLLHPDGKHGVVQKDLIVVADGINSSLVNRVAGKERHLKSTGRSTYRMLVPLKSIQADPDAHLLFADGRFDTQTSTSDPKTARFVIAYPCRNGEIVSVAVFHRTRADRGDQSDWNSPATVADVIESLEGFHPAWHGLVRAAEAVNVFELTYLDVDEVLRSYVNGKSIVLGDAAHPMFPALAGGGTTALEDAASLGVLLSGYCRSDSTKLSQRLKLWDALRVPRDATQQIVSSTMFFPRPADELSEQVRPFLEQKLPKALLMGWRKPQRDFVCGYDVFQITKHALEYCEAQGIVDEPDLAKILQREGVVRHFGMPDSEGSTA